MTLKIAGAQSSNNSFAGFTEQIENEKLLANSAAANEAAINHLANSPTSRINPSNSASDDKKTVGDFLRKVNAHQPFDDGDLSKKEVRIFIDIKKPVNQTTVSDYDNVTWRAIFQKAGYGMLTDDEIALAVGGMNAVGWTVKDSGFDLPSLRGEDAKPGAMVVKTNQAMIERAARAGQAVLQYQEYKAKEADLQKQLAESRTNQMLLDPLRLGGNTPARWAEKMLNTPRDLLQQIDKGKITPFSSTAKWAGKSIAEQIVGQELPEQPSFSESLKRNTGIELPAIPKIELSRPFEYQSEKYKTGGKTGEDIGATAIDLFLLKRGMTNSRVNSSLNLGIFSSPGKTSSITSETSLLRSPISINAIEVPRTPNLPKVTTMDELLKINGVPGSEGVILNQKVVKNAEIWKLSNQNGIEYALTRENGRFVLRSGAQNKVAISTNVRPILHTHPPDELGNFSKLPSKTDINRLNILWGDNPNGTRPASMIIWGNKTNQVTIFRATSPFDILK